MNLDECTVYVFVRQDIPLAQQLVQACHAVWLADHPPIASCTMASGAAWMNQVPLTVSISGTIGGHPNVVVIGVPDMKALERVEAKLKRLQIVHYAWHEPDEPEMDFVSIATAPLDKEQKIPLSNYRLWKYSPSLSESVPSMAKGEPIAPVAQEREHLPLKQEVASLSLAGSSNSVNCP